MAKKKVSRLTSVDQRTLLVLKPSFAIYVAGNPRSSNCGHIRPTSSEPICSF